MGGKSTIAKFATLSILGRAIGMAFDFRVYLLPVRRDLGRPPRANAEY
jgi:hypothetical protein